MLRQGILALVSLAPAVVFGAQPSGRPHGAASAAEAPAAADRGDRPHAQAPDGTTDRTCRPAGPQISTGYYEIWSKKSRDAKESTFYGKLVVTGDKPVGVFAANLETFVWKAPLAAWPSSFHLYRVGPDSDAAAYQPAAMDLVQKLGNVPSCCTPNPNPSKTAGTEQYSAASFSGGSEVVKAQLVRTTAGQRVVQLFGYWPEAGCPAITADAADRWLKISKNGTAVDYKSYGTAN